MSVLAVFTYEIQPGRMHDFMTKLHSAASAKFNSPIMPDSVQLYYPIIPYQEATALVLHIKYRDRAAYEARTAYEQGNAEWVALFAPQPGSPEKLVSMELLEAL